MESQLPHLVTDILASYQRVGGINNIDGSNLPSKRAVASICEDLLQILFPGFHDQEPIHSKELRNATTYRIRSIADRLGEEIFKSLRLCHPEYLEAKSEEAVFYLLGHLPAVRDILKTDVEAAFEGDPATTHYEEIILSYPFLETIAIQRSAHVMYQQKVPIIPRMMTEWAHSRTGIDIHPGAQIGTHFFIDHGTGVVIGETSIIGSRVKLYQGVSLVAKSFQKDDQGRILKGGKRHPNLEDNVTIYANSTILGGDTVIGAGSTIGGNVFLQHSVPANSLVYYEENNLKIIQKRPRNAATPEKADVENNHKPEFVTASPESSLEQWDHWSI